jgi:hypothetical protein
MVNARNDRLKNKFYLAEGFQNLSILGVKYDFVPQV